MKWKLSCQHLRKDQKITSRKLVSSFFVFSSPLIRESSLCTQHNISVAGPSLLRTRETSQTEWWTRSPSFFDDAHWARLCLSFAWLCCRSTSHFFEYNDHHFCFYDDESILFDLIAVGPRFRDSLSRLAVKRDVQASLHCRVDGDSPLHLAWRRSSSSTSLLSSNYRFN